jgi:hypothetical protein
MVPAPTPPARWCLPVCLVLVLTASLPFGFLLDRHPLPYDDDSFFNTPAINFLEGRGFTERVAADAPHGDDFWAYHAPFYPRLQIVTFTLLGVSQFAARLPQFVAANLAVLLLAWGLRRRGLVLPALVLCVAWLGDVTLLQVRNGRMEGLYLLALAGMFVCLLGPVTARRAAGAGMCVGAAIALHPALLVFVLGGAWRVARSGSIRSLAAYTGGISLVGALALACWLPDLLGAIEQFLWHSRQVVRRPAPVAWEEVYWQLRWSKFYAAGLVPATVLLVLLQLLRSRPAGPERAAESAASLAALFAVCSLTGLVVIVGGGFYPYYLTSLSLWPVIGLASAWVAQRQAGRLGWMPAMVAAVLALCWLPSLAWNGARLHEALALQEALDPAPFRHQLQTTLPAGSELLCSREFDFLVRGVPGIRGHSLPWYAKCWMPPADAWLLLRRSREDELRPKQAPVDPASLTDRPIVWSGSPFQVPLKDRIVLYGPAKGK